MLFCSLGGQWIVHSTFCSYEIRFVRSMAGYYPYGFRVTVVLVF